MLEESLVDYLVVLELVDEDLVVPGTVAIFAL
jgi:hypothetical protein